VLRTAEERTGFAPPHARAKIPVPPVHEFRVYNSQRNGYHAPYQI
jgi:hypothetical protein